MDLCVGLCLVFTILVNFVSTQTIQHPEQIHIAVGDSPDKIRVVWNTQIDTGDTNQILYGTDGKVSKVQKANTTKFIDGGSKKRSQYVHQAMLTGLEPNTVYTYMVGSTRYGYSDQLSFKTWPSGYDWAPSLAVYGDMGNTNARSIPRLETDLAAGMYDAILHVGDFAYDMHSNNGLVGDEFMRQIENLASKVPYMTCPGNHENAYNVSNYKKSFWMPGDDDKKMFFSFNMGPVHFISVSSEHLFYPVYGMQRAVRQYEWLEKDLIEANKPENRKQRPWIMLYGHRPMYCSNTDGDDCTHNESKVRVGIPALKIPGMETLLFKYGVDIALWGHEHSYERMWPVYDRKVYNGSKEAPFTNPGATVHITSGSAGCREGHDPFGKTGGPWSVFRSQDYGYLRMKVYNNTHVYMEQVSDDKDGAVIDRVMVIKETHGPFAKNPNPVMPIADPLKKEWKTWQRYLQPDGTWFFPGDMM